MSQNIKKSLPSALPPSWIDGSLPLDTEDLVSACKMLMGEIVLDDLLLKIVSIMIGHAGAHRGLLLFKEGGHWVIRARGKSEKGEVYSTHQLASSLDVPLSIVTAAAASRSFIVHNGEIPEERFADDIYILQKKPKSILCAPIVYQGTMPCIIYLENNDRSDAFPPARQELIRFLVSQAAASLINSKLYAKFAKIIEQLHTEMQRHRQTQLQLLHAEKLAALGRLSASIAHEFGNPLIGIRYLLQDIGTRPNLSRDDKDLLQIGLEECDRMKQLIADLQKLNRPSSGKRKRFNIHNAIDNVLLFQKKNLKSKKISVVKAYDCPSPEIIAVEDQIAQVLVNLTINAADAMPAEGGSLIVSTSGNSDSVSISIKDTGSGIRPEVRDHIFEPFFSTKPEPEGTGLGLSVSYSIIAGHAGNIAFSSEPAKGSTFTVTLPVSLPQDRRQPR